MVADDDGAALTLRHTVEPESVHVWRPSSRVEHGIGCKRSGRRRAVRPACCWFKMMLRTSAFTRNIYAVLAHFTGGEGYGCQHRSRVVIRPPR